MSVRRVFVGFIRDHRTRRIGRIKAVRRAVSEYGGEDKDSEK